MVPTSLIVVSVDGLRASSLGAYGNTSFPTPYLDRLASESVVYDHYLVGSADLDSVVSSLWTGQHLLAEGRGERVPTLASRLRGEGLTCVLVTDDKSLTSHASDWDEVVLIETRAVEPAQSVAETGMGIVLASALEVGMELSERPEPLLLWIHLRAMQAPWDAPTQLAYSLRDEKEDPLWEPSIMVPRYTAEASSGDDRAFVASCRYAGQVMALDECLEGFVNELIVPARSWDLVFLGVRGFPLGEHGAVGQPVPYNEQFHVPLSIRYADGAHRLTRFDGLVQPTDVFSWLSQFPQSRQALKPMRTLAVSQGADRIAMASGDWRVVASANGAKEPEVELYSFSDDRWQANNIASLCPEEAAAFSKLCQHSPMSERSEKFSGPPQQGASGDRSGPGGEA